MKREFNPTSFGPDAFWHDVGLMVMFSPNLIRKVGNYVKSIRSIRNAMFCKWTPEEMEIEAEKYAKQAFKDMRLPVRLRWAVYVAIKGEFGYDVWSLERNA
jgi:hypothetical protein